jgi:hypothetical protein
LGRTPKEATPPPPAPRPKGQTPRPLPNGPTLQHPQPRQASRLPLNLPPARTLSATAQPLLSTPPPLPARANQREDLLIRKGLPRKKLPHRHRSHPTRPHSPRTKTTHLRSNPFPQPLPLPPRTTPRSHLPPS